MNLIRYALLILLFTTIGAFSQRTQAQTQERPALKLVQEMPPVGLAFGQSLRITVRNSVAPAARPKKFRFRILVTALVIDLDGNVIAQSDEIALLPDESHSFDFKRDAFPLTGEPGTGRVQLVVQVIYKVRNANSAGLEKLPSFSAEIIDDATGRTTIHGGFSGSVNVGSGDVNNTPTDPSAQNATSLVSFEGVVGFVRGQTLRVSVFNPTAQISPGYVRFITTTTDTQLPQSPVLLIPPGGFRFFDLNADALSLTGEPGTGRVQMAATIFLKWPPTELRESPSASMELIDNSTGRTTALLLPAIQKIRFKNCCVN